MERSHHFKSPLIVLRQGGEDPSAFAAAFDDMLAFLQRTLRDPAKFASIEAELADRRVVCLSYFDVVIDFILLDAFDDLKVATSWLSFYQLLMSDGAQSPPQAVLNVLQNKWIPKALKRTV